MATDGIKPHYVIEDAIEHLYDVYTFGRTILTTVTKYPEAVTEWIKDVKPDNTLHLYIGLEVEAFPGEFKRPRIGTLQLCVGNRCLVIQLYRTSPYPTCLNQFLTDKNHTFVGLDLDLKLSLLFKQFPVEGAVSFRDLGDLAASRYRLPRLIWAGQHELVSFALGMELEKPWAEPNWGRSGNLSDKQVQVACIEAFVCFELGRWLIRK